MKSRFVIILLLLLLFFSCRENVEKDLNFLHLEQISKDFSTDLADVSKDIIATANTIKSKIKFEKEVNWNEQSRYIFNQNEIIYGLSDKNLCAIFLPAGKKLTPVIKKAIINSEPVDSLLIDICYNNSIVSQAYFLDTNSFIRIYPFFDVAKQYLPITDLTEFNAFKSVANKPLYEDQAYWIKEPYADPSGRGWIISCLAPIYYHESFFGVISADIMLKTICEKYIFSDSEKFLLINARGEILSCSRTAANFLKITIKDEYPYYKPFTYDIFLKGNPSLLMDFNKDIQKAINSLIQGEKMAEMFYESNKIKIYSSNIKQTNWLLLKIIN